MTKAEDLKCGEAFVFRGETYLCLSNFTDMRHTQSIITCIRGEMVGTVWVLRLFRTFEVLVSAKNPYMKLEVLDNSLEELAAVETMPEKYT